MKSWKALVCLLWGRIFCLALKSHAMMQPLPNDLVESDGFVASSSFKHKASPLNALTDDFNRKANVGTPLSCLAFNEKLDWLILEEAELAGFVMRWEWLSAFPSRLRDCQSLRQALSLERMSCIHVDAALPNQVEIMERSPLEIPYKRAALAQLNVGTYYLAHYLSTAEVHAEFTFHARLLSEDQRTEMYAEMHRRCVNKERTKSNPIYMHMEIDVCPVVERLEKLLHKLRDSNLPNLLAKKHALSKKEREQQKEKMERPHSSLNLSLRFKNQPIAPRLLVNPTKPFTLSPERWFPSGVKAATPVPMVAQEPVETKEWSELRQEIALENMRLNQVLHVYSVFSTRFRAVITQEHEAVVQKAREWSKEAFPTQKKFLERRFTMA